MSPIRTLNITFLPIGTEYRVQYDMTMTMMTPARGFASNVAYGRFPDSYSVPYSDNFAAGPPPLFLIFGRYGGREGVRGLTACGVRSPYFSDPPFVVWKVPCNLSYR